MKNLLVCVFLGLLDQQFTLGAGGQCNRVPFPNVEIGKTLMETPFMTLHDLSQIHCAIECQKRGSCKALSYNMSNGTCILYDVTDITGGNKIPLIDSTYSRVDTWPSSIAGVCASNTCGMFQVCVETPGSASYVCITECYKPPDIQNGSIIFETSIETWSVGDILNFTCEPGFYKDGGQLECLSTSKWSTVSCNPITSCLDIGTKCGSNFNSGDYLVYTAGYKLLMVYCTGNNLVDSYVTLPAPNYSEITGTTCFISYGGGNLCGLTTFNKILVSTANMRIKLIANTQAFSTLTGCSGSVMRFGNAAGCTLDGECSGSSPGKMHINMTGSGIIVDPTTKWKKNDEDAVITVQFDPDSRIIDILCDGECGVCTPTTSGVYFEVNLQDDVDHSAATLPICD